MIDRGELSNGASQKTGEREIHVSQELIDLFDDYAYDILDELEIDTNFVFVKLRGKNKGQPLDGICQDSCRISLIFLFSGDYFYLITFYQ